MYTKLEYYKNIIVIDSGFLVRDYKTLSQEIKIYLTPSLMVDV